MGNGNLRCRQIAQNFGKEPGPNPFPMGGQRLLHQTDLCETVERRAHDDPCPAGLNGELTVREGLLCCSVCVLHKQIHFSGQFPGHVCSGVKIADLSGDLNGAV